ncbi:MAG: hypothetical protein IPI67_39610 [Myxococcales bacterium]|nr:hypothetical protein [Myxococcales bacterium]
MSGSRPRSRWNALLVSVIALAAGAGACGKVLSGDGEEHIQVRAGECYSCHQPDYEGAAKPPHVNVMPTVCGACHSEDAWIPAKFEHSWPILGAHQALACQSCHVGDPPKYAGTPRECVGCHQKDYDGSPYPGHNTFPTTCDACHNQVAWKPASAAAHPFPLDGAHATAPCTACHVGDPPVYKGTPKDCFSCHVDDYDKSPFPGHQGFSHVCSDCHSTTAWKPAAGGHPENKFPLAGSKHSNVKCAECHDANLGSAAKSNINCVTCHGDAKMDSVHKDEGKYPQTSSSKTFCLDCHPDGRK